MCTGRVGEKQRGDGATSCRAAWTVVETSDLILAEAGAPEGLEQVRDIT